jgi:hypothetical protein
MRDTELFNSKVVRDVTWSLRGLPSYNTTNEPKGSHKLRLTREQQRATTLLDLVLKLFVLFDQSYLQLNHLD